MGVFKGKHKKGLCFSSKKPFFYKQNSEKERDKVHSPFKSPMKRTVYKRNNEKEKDNVHSPFKSPINKKHKLSFSPCKRSHSRKTSTPKKQKESFIHQTTINIMSHP